MERVDDNDEYGSVSESNIEEDHCLIFWNPNDDGTPTSENLTAFLSGMQLCNKFDSLSNGCQDTFSSKTDILFPLIAFERKITYVLELTNTSTNL